MHGATQAAAGSFAAAASTNVGMQASLCCAQAGKNVDK
jgi:hypothetical protein